VTATGCSRSAEGPTASRPEFRGRTTGGHRVAVVAADTVVSFELGAVVHVLQSAALLPDGPRYDVGVVGPPHPVATSTMQPDGGRGFAVVPDRPLEWAATADTVIIPGHTSFLAEVPPEVAVLIKETQERGARLVAFGLGTFALAAAGVLEGRSATTHWRWSAELAARHPSLVVLGDTLFVDDGSVHTAAGAAAALDLILHLVEKDRGAVVAASIANQVVAPPRRSGREAQHLQHEVPPDDHDGLRNAMLWAEEHLAQNLQVADLAAQAHMSTRNFSRRFRRRFGATPIEWLLQVRIRHARRLLETTTWTIERVADRSGFRTPGVFRHHFVRIVDTTPGHYRREHRAKGRASSGIRTRGDSGPA
jgi:AraC family transcriptional regulator, transcriptional activator FtrA